MRAFLSWSDTINDHEGNQQPIYDIAFSPDGSEILAAVGNQILVYESNEGSLIQTLKAHKDTVYCLDYSKDGKQFASGGADKDVIIWNNKYEGILKYHHNDPIQHLSFNPVSGQVVSCTLSDFGLWSAEQKSVIKHKVPSRILCSSWTSDGQYVALGMYNGHISIRNKLGEEKLRIERSVLPIWALSWNPSPHNDQQILAVTDWSRKLSFFQLNGRQVGRDRILDYDPCSIDYFSNGGYVVIGGSDNKVSLWTTDGINIGTLCERNSWVWCCKVRPNQNYVAVGCNDGTISMYQVVFSTVHGLHHDRYAYRDNMTDVVIQHLSTNQRARIRCRDYVKKIAVYRDRLAVQLPEKIIIYELFHDDATDMHYRIKEKIIKKLDCNLLVVTSEHIILCQEKKLQMFNFSGEKEKEWNLESLIRYIKVIGGPKKQECLLVGLKNGQILKIFLNNAFPIEIMKLDSAIHCLDLSLSRNKLAVIDEQYVCSVYDLRTNTLLYQEPNASSVAWNMENEDMLCYSGNGSLYVKVDDFPSYEQKMQGFVVGFKGTKVFCLHVYSMSTIHIPQTASLECCIEKKEFNKGYGIITLGVTDDDCEKFAYEALLNLDLDIAKKAYIRIRDLKHLELIQVVERMIKEGKHNKYIILGEINAYESKYSEAAQYFIKGGDPQRAIDMYTSLNKWSDATKIAHDANINIESILKKKAIMQQSTNDNLAAASTYIEVGDYVRAINILGSNKAFDRLIEVVHLIDKSEKKALSLCVDYFKKNNETKYALETLTKMGDIGHLLNLHIELHNWEEAFSIAETHPDIANQIYLPYANWLSMNNRFIEAQEYFRKAKKPEEAYKVLEQLTVNSIIEKRFDDASYYIWILSQEHLENIPSDLTYNELSNEDKNSLKKFYEYQKLSEIYYVYYFIQRYIDEPFTPHLPEALFSMSRYILNYGNKHSLPHGVSKLYILYALAKISSQLGAYQLSKTIYDKMQQLKIPEEWRESIDLGTVLSRGKSDSDKEDLKSVCYQCSFVNPLLNQNGDECSNCFEPFVHSFYSFENLPVVEFSLQEGITEEEAIKLINKDSYIKDLSSSNENVQQMKIGSDKENDLFLKLLAGAGRDTREQYKPIEVDRETLKAMNKHDVFMKKWNKKCIPIKFYKSVLTEISITVCPVCNHFFESTEYEFSLLQKQACPFCRNKTIKT
ncbi:WD40-repeat-containing domain protein [Neocallimastix lanati (nom. inval.)]|jgi:intraflagellar transport protein 122